MTLEKACLQDVESIMAIIAYAQETFKKAGINQWQNGYPNPMTIEQDIKLGNSYKLMIDAELVATCAVIFDVEPTYDQIFEGQWLTNRPYATVHRIAIAASYKGKGLSHTIMRAVEALCLENDIQDIRVDTQEDNLAMQGLLKKAGYTYCGIIFLADGQKRLAYQKILT